MQNNIEKVQKYRKFYLHKFYDNDPFFSSPEPKAQKWAYSIPVEPASVRPCVHTFKHEYLWNQWADRNQILSEASLGWGKGCIWFWARSDQNSGFLGNRKLP